MDKHMLLLSMSLWIAAVLTHSAVSRSSQQGGAVRRFVLVGCFYGALLVAGMAAMGHFSTAAILLYVFFCELYLFLFTLAANSVSLGILVRLHRSSVQASDLAVDYSTDEMIHRRVEQSGKAGLIVQTPAGWRITPKGVAVVNVFGILRGVFRQSSYDKPFRACGD